MITCVYAYCILDPLQGLPQQSWGKSVYCPDSADYGGSGDGAGGGVRVYRHVQTPVVDPYRGRWKAGVLYYPIIFSHFCIHSGIMPVGQFSRKCAKSINQSSVDLHYNHTSQFWLDWFIGFVPHNKFITYIMTADLCLFHISVRHSARCGFLTGNCWRNCGLLRTEHGVLPLCISGGKIVHKIASFTPWMKTWKNNGIESINQSINRHGRESP